MTKKFQVIEPNNAKYSCFSPKIHIIVLRGDFVISKHIKIYGRVQGVGFRNATVKVAKKFKVTGTVQNVENYVEVFVTGENDEVESFINKVIIGPSPFSKVLSYEINDIPLKDYTEFKKI